MLAIDAQQRVLLIRHSYGSDKWMPPGGGLKRGEDALKAAARELLEETGCRLDAATLVAHSDEVVHGAGNAVQIVVGWTADLPVPDGREVIEAAFFALHELPDHMPALFRGALADWIRAATTGHRPDAAGLRPPPAPTG